MTTRPDVINYINLQVFWYAIEHCNGDNEDALDNGGLYSSDLLCEPPERMAENAVAMDGDHSGQETGHY